MLFFNQLSWLVRSDRSGFAVAATVDLAHMLDHSDLHWHDLKLLADFLTNAVFTATAGAGQFVLGQFVDDLDARQIGRQWLALASALGGSNDLFFCIFVGNVGDAFSFIEKG